MQLPLSCHYSIKRCTFAMNQPRINDPHSIPFDSRYSTPMSNEFQKSHFMRLNFQFEFDSIYLQDQLGLETETETTS